VKLLFLSIGKTKDPSIKSLISDYSTRLKRYFPCEIIELKEDKNISSKDRGKIIKKEGEKLLEYIKPGSFTFVLDEKGKNYITREFSKFFEGKLSGGFKQITFIIGGPFGISEEVKKKASSLFSLSKLTFTHEMSRVILLEQVFRAMTIIKGERYHY